MPFLEREQTSPRSMLPTTRELHLQPLTRLKPHFEKKKKRDPNQKCAQSVPKTQSDTQSPPSNLPFPTSRYSALSHPSAHTHPKVHTHSQTAEAKPQSVSQPAHPSTRTTQSVSQPAIHPHTHTRKCTRAVRQSASHPSARNAQSDRPTKALGPARLAIHPHTHTRESAHAQSDSRRTASSEGENK